MKLASTIDTLVIGNDLSINFQRKNIIVTDINRELNITIMNLD